MLSTNAPAETPKIRRGYGLLAACATTAMLTFGTMSTPALAVEGDDLVSIDVVSTGVTATPAGTADAYIPLGDTGADFPSFIILGVALVMTAGSVVLTVRRKEAADRAASSD